MMLSHSGPMVQSTFHQARAFDALLVLPQADEVVSVETTVVDAIRQNCQSHRALIVALPDPDPWTVARYGRIRQQCTRHAVHSNPTETAPCRAASVLSRGPGKAATALDQYPQSGWTLTVPRRFHVRHFLQTASANSHEYEHFSPIFVNEAMVFTSIDGLSARLCACLCNESYWVRLRRS
jgi:hypothetical protein